VKKEKINKLLPRYFTGECSLLEKRKIENWINANDKNKNEFSEQKGIWERLTTREINWNIESSWQKFALEHNIDIEKKQTANVSIIEIKPFRKSASLYLGYIIRTAAVLLIMLGGYFILQQTGIFNSKTKTEIAWNQKTTLMGEKFMLTLSEGTKVTLNADSKFKYPIRFNNNSREVFLEGEAYFEVEHDSSKPFIVHSGKISTTVLGTKFNVSAFPEEKRITVSLVEGKVKVSKEKENDVEEIVELKPKQQLVFNKEKEISTFDEFDLQKATGWKDNIFKFDEEPLGKVLIKLERAYGIKFELANKSFADYTITARFENSSIWTISEVIKKLTGLRYKTIKENNETKKIIFYKK
jgi:transmembrane sensor